MIQKIKDLMAIKEHIDVIKNNLNYTTNSVNELKAEIGSLKQHVNNNMNEIDNKRVEFFENSATTPIEFDVFFKNDINAREPKHRRTSNGFYSGNT